jgi:hypothetical protein
MDHVHRPLEEAPWRMIDSGSLALDDPRRGRRSAP